MAFLQEQGFEIVYIDVDAQGIVNLEQLTEAVNQDTILVSIMYVNNEIGAVQPIKRDCRQDKREKSGCIISCRCDSGIWKIPYLSEADGN